MREILFRGKNRHGEWVYGYYCPKPFTCFPCEPAILPSNIINIAWQAVRIDPETLGEFTGLTDKNGVKIFEGDIVVYDFDESDVNGSQHTAPNEVRYDAETASFLAVEKCNGIEGCTSLDGLPWRIVGNIYDNPELLEVKDDAV